MDKKDIKNGSLGFRIKKDDEEEDWYPDTISGEEEDYIRCPHCHRFIKKR